MEASYAMVRILQTFTYIKSRDRRGFTEHIGLNLFNENGVIVELSSIRS